MQRHEVINSLIRDSNKKYLEIGVQRGITFRQIKFNEKDGVDPYPILEGNEIVNYKVTSDDFFEKYIQKKYDFIFIDGLHETHQLIKDFKNSYYSLNNKGIIIFDDILPQNKYEQTIPVSNVEGPCTGDVWKLIYYIIINKDKFNLQKMSSFINMSSDSRGMLLMEFNIIQENNVFFQDINNLDLSRYYTYDNDFNNYKELLFTLRVD